MKRLWIWRILAVWTAAGVFFASVSAADRATGDVLALMYHDLTEDMDALSPWRTMPGLLRQDLCTLMEAGYAPLSVEAYAAGEYDRTGIYFVVTFDDGYLSNLTLAEPVLRELGVPAAVFVITSLVGEAGHMTWPQLRQLEEGGVFTVYSHTHTHLRADGVPAEEFLADVERSWELLEKNGFGSCRRIFSYPHGAYTRESMEALANAGCELFLVQNRVVGVSEKVHVLVRRNAPPGVDYGGLIQGRRNFS